MDELGEGDFVARTQFVNGDQIVEARSNDRLVATGGNRSVLTVTDPRGRYRDLRRRTPITASATTDAIATARTTTADER